MNFLLKRRIKFYETDAMGIVHHAVYLHLFEDARIEFLRAQGWLEQCSLEEINFPLLESQVRHQKPLYFDDEAEILLQLTSDLLRLTFTYEIRTKRYPDVVAFGKTIHIAMDMRTRRPVRLPAPLKKLS